MSESHIRILLVEDNPGDARLLKEMLRDASPHGRYQVEEASSLNDAVAALSRGSQADVVLLDLHLPDSAGLRTLAKVQKAASHVPVVVLTGLTDEETGISALHQNAQDYLVKGHFDGPVLTRSMAYAIARKQTEIHRQHAHERVLRLVRLSKDVLATTTPEALLRCVVASARELIGARIGVAGFGIQDSSLRIGVYSREGDPNGQLMTLPLKRQGVTEDLIRRVCTIRFSDHQLMTHPRMGKLPPEHPRLVGLIGSSFAGAGGEPTGMILLSDKVSGEFTAEDEARLSQLAGIASLGLQHIAAREQAQKHARELNAVFDAMVQPVVINDDHCRPIMANIAAVAAAGMDPTHPDRQDEFLALTRRYPDGRAIPPDQRASARALSGQTVVDEPQLFTNAEGKTSSILVSASPIFHEGKVTNAVVVWQDVTERERLVGELRQSHEQLDRRVKQRTQDLAATIDILIKAQEQLRRANRALRVLSESNQAMVHAADDNKLLSAACRNLIDFGGYRIAMIAWPGDTRGLKRPIIQAGLAAKAPKNHALLKPGGPSDDVFRTGKPIIARNLETTSRWPQWRQDALRRGIRSMIAMPLVVDGKMRAALTICSGDADAFDSEEVKLLKDLAEDVSFGLSSLRARRERQLAQRAMVEQAQVARAFFSHTATPLAFLDPEFNFVQVNDAYARAFSIPADSLRGHNLLDLLPPQLKPMLRSAVRTKRPHSVLAQAMVFHDHPEWGTTYWDMSMVPILDGSRRVTSLVYSLNDVTDRKRNEERTLATNELLELFTRRGSRHEYVRGVCELFRHWTGCRCVGIRLADGDQRVPYEASMGFNQKFLRQESSLSLRTDDCACIRVILAQPAQQEMKYMTPRGGFVCNDAEAFVKSITPRQRERYRGVCSQCGFQTVAVLPVRHRNRILGAIHIADSQKDMLSPDLLEFLELMSPMIGEALNRFAMEDALRVSEEHFRSMIESSEDCIAHLSLDGRYLSMNATGCELQGFHPPSEVVGRDAMAGIKENIEGFKLALSLVQKGEIASVQYKFQVRADREIWWDCKLSPVRDGEGKVAGILLVSRDVTERRGLEREIVEVGSQERRRIGRDLHDSLGQLLTGIAFLCKSLQQRMSTRNLPEAASAGELSDLVNKAINQTRMLAHGLCPVEPKAEGLTSALRQLAEHVEKTCKISCIFSYDRSLRLEDDYKATQLYHIAQEAVNNATKHSRASRIGLSLNNSRGAIKLSVEDDGVGIRADSRKGMGLRTMRYRADMIGASLEIDRARPHGTKVTCMLSVPQGAVVQAPN